MKRNIIGEPDISSGSELRHFEPTRADLDDLKDKILAGARKKVDPDGVGFDALMMTTDDGDFFSTDDVTFGEWWTWVERVSSVISQAASRLGLGIMAAGSAIAAAQMFNSQAGAQYGKATLAVSGLLGGWFVVSAVISSVRGK